MRTRLWRCSPEQLRAALPSELLGRDLISNPELGELLRQVVSGTHAGAVDVSREGPPAGEDVYGPVQREEEGIPLGHPVEVSSARGPGASDQTEHSGPWTTPTNLNGFLQGCYRTSLQHHVSNFLQFRKTEISSRLRPGQWHHLLDSLQHRPDDSRSMSQLQNLRP